MFVGGPSRQTLGSGWNTRVRRTKKFPAVGQHRRLKLSVFQPLTTTPRGPGPAIRPRSARTAAASRSSVMKVQHEKIDLFILAARRRHVFCAVGDKKPVHLEKIRGRWFR